MAGTFITFEGIDGSGKSTQLRLLSGFLRMNSCDVVLTREPGGTPLGLRLRSVLLDAQEEVDPLTELLVFAADRAQHVRRLLRPTLASGRVVLSDRYADATVAYQGAGRGFSPWPDHSTFDCQEHTRPSRYRRPRVSCSRAPSLSEYSRRRTRARKGYRYERRG